MAEILTREELKPWLNPRVISNRLIEHLEATADRLDALTHEVERLRNPWLPITASLPKADQWPGCLVAVGDKRKSTVFRWLPCSEVWVSSNYGFDTPADFTQNGFTHYMLIPSLPEGVSK